jgi:ParB-like chromosome segregation protein Spo0J
MNTIRVKIEEVKPNPKNPRIITDEKFKKLVKSVKEFPKMLELRPIVVNEDMVVLGGNMRLKAYKEAGVTEIPVIKASTLTPEEQQEFVIKDNVGFGDWDWSALEEQYDDKTLLDWGLELPEFNLDNLDYGILEDDEDELEEQLSNMKGSIRKAIQIEFEPEHYEEANELVRYWREQKLYVGGFLIEKLKEEKENG